MSRHRNVRNYSYEDEMSEDVYGHSVEEYDLCISPSTAQQFMYNRGSDKHKSDLYGNYMSGRFGSVEEEKEEVLSEDEDHLGSSEDYSRPQLDPISEAKLSSCLDQLQSVLGDDCHEPTAVDAILRSNFDVEQALDYIFSKESKKASSTKKTVKKQDSNMHCKYLNKNMMKPVRSHNIFEDSVRLGALPPLSEGNKKKIHNSISDKNSLLCMSLSNIIMESKNQVTAPKASENMMLFAPLGSLMDSCKKDSSSLNVSEVSPMASSLESLSSVRNLREVTSSSGKTDFISTSLSSLHKQHDDSNRAKPVVNSGISLQELANKWQSPLTKAGPLSDKPDDTLTSTSLSGLAKQHDNSNRAQPVGIHCISLQELANKGQSPLTKTGLLSDKPEDTLTPRFLSNLVKQHDDSNRAQPVGIHCISLQELANKRQSPLTKTGLLSDKSEDTLTPGFLSNLANSSTKANAMALSEIFPQDSAKQIQSPNNQEKQFPCYSDGAMDVDPLDSIFGQQACSDSTINSSPEGQKTQCSTQDVHFTTSLSSLASLSLHSDQSSLFTKRSEISNKELSGRNNSATTASGVLEVSGSNSGTRRRFNAIQSKNQQSSLNQKLSNSKIQGSRVEERLFKVNQKSLKKNKRTYRISQSSMLLMYPTMFVKTLCSARRQHSIPEHLKSKKLFTSGDHSCNSNIVPFSFTTSSPDDVIKMKQQQRFGVQRKFQNDQQQ